jgi:membrane fusion protein (multidrug efflux system)
MQQLTKKITVIALLSLAVACGESKKENSAAINEKKAELEQLKKQEENLKAKITKVEEDLAKIDTSAAKAEKEKLVAITPVQTENFAHFIDLQGTIEADNSAYVTPRNGGGQVKEVLVRQGDVVRQGQLLLKLDDAITKQSLAAAEQRLSELNTQIAYSKDLLKRQQNLWSQGIGTEVQLITAKNNVASLENQLKSAEASIKVNKEQVNTSNVYAEVSGVADEVTIRVGEVFTGSAMSGGIHIVNTSKLKVTAQVPEVYLDKVHTGSKVDVHMPDINKNLSASITNSGKLIDPLSRAFYIEARIAPDKDLRPNQVAMVKIQDYVNPTAITIPVNTLQNDEKGKFVMVATKEGNKLVARKKQVAVGELYGDKLEVKMGIVAGDVLITDGFQGLYDGQPITTSVK